MTLGRALHALLLSLILAWGSLTQAVAHSEMAGYQAVVLCDSTGQAASIVLDAEGNRVDPPSCQHCLAASALAVLADPARIPHPQTLPRPATPSDLAQQVAPGPSPSPVQPRAPPSMA